MHSCGELNPSAFQLASVRIRAARAGNGGCALKTGSGVFRFGFRHTRILPVSQTCSSAPPFDKIPPEDDAFDYRETRETKPRTGSRVREARQYRKLFGVQRLPQLASLQNVVKLDVAKLFVERHTRRGHRSGVFLAPRPSKLLRGRTGAFTPSVAAHPEHGTDNLGRAPRRRCE